jgi:hypothetical protein
MEVKMNWIPVAILAKHAINAAARYDEEQSARFRCRICWTNNHTTHEHQHPQLSDKRKAQLIKCQLALPFLLAVLIGTLSYLLRIGWFLTIVEWMICWPVWVRALAYRFRKAQIKENEVFYRHLEEARFAAATAAGKDFLH